MTDTPMVEVAVALGRIEEALKGVNQKLDRLEKTTESHWRKISEIETEIALLKERHGPRIPWVTWAAGIAALAALVLGILDRIFVNQ